MLTVSYFRPHRTRDENRPSFPPQWANNNIAYRNAVDQFRSDTKQFRRSKAFRSFDIRPKASSAPSFSSPKEEQLKASPVFSISLPAEKRQSGTDDAPRNIRFFDAVEPDR